MSIGYPLQTGEEIVEWRGQLCMNLFFSLLLNELVQLGYHYQELDVFVEKEGVPVIDPSESQRSVYRRALAAGISGLIFLMHSLKDIPIRASASLSRSCAEDPTTSSFRCHACHSLNPSFSPRLPSSVTLTGRCSSVFPGVASTDSSPAAQNCV